jgi:PAP2 superfamily
MNYAFKQNIGTYLFAIICFISWECTTDKESHVLYTHNVATRWADMALQIAERTPSNTPTYASRGFGYIGITMYESVVHGSPTHRSMAGQLNGLSSLPQPENGKTYQWELSLNAAQAFMLRNIYEHTRDINKLKIDSLETLIYTEIGSRIDKNTTQRSIEYGRKVAEAIFEWSKNDGGYQGYKRNFDLSYTWNKTDSTWKTPIFGQSKSSFPLHPYWGNNRTFVLTNADMAIPKPFYYSINPNSDYYKQFAQVYQINKNLTQTQKEIALWWGDDPAFSFTPPGHSYSIANITVKATNVDLFKAGETFARVGMATADAFITCWKCKYTYFSERPSTFIRNNIDKDWLSFWPEPPFPAFISGHATQGAATATVLSDLYGENFKFTDTSHEGRENDPITNTPYKTRSFSSFWEAAEESALSRLYGGIHSQLDNEIGLKEGKKVGLHINHLSWSK